MSRERRSAVSISWRKYWKDHSRHAPAIYKQGFLQKGKAKGAALGEKEHFLKCCVFELIIQFRKNIFCLPNTCQYLTDAQNVGSVSCRCSGMSPRSPSLSGGGGGENMGSSPNITAAGYRAYSKRGDQFVAHIKAICSFSF